MGRQLVLLGVVTAICAGFGTGVPEAAAPVVSVQVFNGDSISRPHGITAGPDGALWFTNEEGRSIGRMTVQGALSSFTGPGISTPSGITSGPDGALWFLNGTGSIGQITLSGAVRTFTAANTGSAIGLAAGPDGALWFTTGGKSIGRISTDGAVRFFGDPTRMRGTYGIASGPDGAIWFSNHLGSSIGRISADGSVTVYTDARIRYPVGIIAGPDGALWFADDAGSIGRITTTGVVTSFGDPETVGHPFAITVGPDGALWATDRGGAIVRITVGGSISRYTDSRIRFPVGIAAGPDGALWFTNYSGGSIGRARIGAPRSMEPAPRLTVVRPGGATAAAIVRSGAVTVVRARVRVDRRASLTLTVRSRSTGLALRLDPGSRVAATILSRPAKAVRGSISAGRPFVVEAALPTRELARGRAYELVLDAVGTTRTRSRLKINFHG